MSKQEKKKPIEKIEEVEATEKPVEKKNKFSFKNLTKRKKVLLIIAVVVLAAAIALSVALPLTLIQKPLEPYFLEFDQKSDSYLTLAWNSVKGAQAYLVEYYFNEEEPQTAYASGTQFKIDRKIGIVHARVMPVGDKVKNASFSGYVQKEISPLTLTDPSVTISDRGVIEWTDVYYWYRGERVAVKMYTVELKIGDGEYSSTMLTMRDEDGLDWSDLIKSGIVYDPDLEEEYPWTDVQISVRVKARTVLKDDYGFPRDKPFLKGAYVESDGYGVVTKNITKEIYEGM